MKICFSSSTWGITVGGGWGGGGEAEIQILPLQLSIFGMGFRRAFKNLSSLAMVRRFDFLKNECLAAYDTCYQSDTRSCSEYVLHPPGGYSLIWALLVCAVPKCMVGLLPRFDHKKGIDVCNKKTIWVSASSLNMGMSLKGSYLFNIIEKTMNKSPSQIYMLNIGLN